MMDREMSQRTYNSVDGSRVSRMILAGLVLDFFISLPLPAYAVNTNVGLEKTKISRSTQATLDGGQGSALRSRLTR